MAWNRLAETCGKYLGKGQQVAVEGRIATRTWDDDQGTRHWKTEIVAVERRDAVPGGARRTTRPRRPRQALEAQARASGYSPDATEPIADDAGFSVAAGADGDEEDDEDELLEEAVAA